MTTTSIVGPEPEPFSSVRPILSQEAAEALLQPYVDILNRCIDDGWNAWKTDYAHKTHLLDGRARAAIVYCEIVYQAKAAFSGLPDVKVVHTGGTLSIFIGQVITLRFKKIGKTGRCSNILTRRQILFLAQMQLPGMLDGTLIHAGYQLNELQQAIQRKAVVCQLNQRVLWQITISGEPGELAVMPPISDLGIPQSGPRFVAKKEFEVTPAEAEERKG
jgi:hypothetical protein